MPSGHKKPYLWHPASIDFMNALIRAYPNIKCAEIAERLTVHFGKFYSKDAVIGKQWRDRRKHEQHR